MSKLDFKIVNDIQQLLPPSLPGGPWVHHATIVRRNHEYLVFRHGFSNCLYIEEVEQDRVNIILKKIEDEQEWEALYQFCNDAGLLRMDNEMKINDNLILSKKWLT
jgi:hypothetical protein